MTEKELHKLRRHDLLQLLLAQGREAAKLQAQIDGMTAELDNLQEANNRFIGRMDDKDAQIEKLKGRLDEKDAQVEAFKERLKEKDVRIDRLKGRLEQKDTQIEELRKVIGEYRSGRIFEMGGRVSIAEVGQKLEGIFVAAQKAVEQYLESVEVTAGTESSAADSMANSDNTGLPDATAEAPDSFSAEINDTEEQYEKETDVRSDGGSHTGAA